MVSSEADPTQNPASIFYLYPASIKLVSTSFDGSGYADWKRSMIIGLTAKNKLSFIDGTAVKLSSDSSDSKCWERCNNLVIGWIIASLDRVLAKSVMYYNNAYEIWSDLANPLQHNCTACKRNLQTSHRHQT